MKNATPSDIIFKRILEKIDDLLGHCAFYFVDGLGTLTRDVCDDDDLKEKYIKIIESIESLYDNGHIKENKFKSIKKLLKPVNKDVIYRGGLVFENNENNFVSKYVFDLLPEITFEDKFENSPFFLRFSKIIELLSGQISKREKARNLIKGLKQPVVWENISLLFDGVNIQVIQNEKNLGLYSLDELNFPKNKTVKEDKIIRGVRGFFISLFFDVTDKSNSVLNSKNNNNQKLKANLFNILCDAFSTNKDPIKIENEIYRPLFKARFARDLRVNEHSSGGELFDNYEY